MIQGFTFKCKWCGKIVTWYNYMKDYKYQLDGKYFCCYSCYKKYMDKFYPKKTSKLEEEYYEG